MNKVQQLFLHVYRNVIDVKQASYLFKVEVEIFSFILKLDFESLNSLDVLQRAVLLHQSSPEIFDGDFLLELGPEFALFDWVLEIGNVLEWF